MSRSNSLGVDTKAEAAYWKVTVRTVQRWIASGIDVRDRNAVADHVLALPKAKAETRAVAQDLKRQAALGRPVPRKASGKDAAADRSGSESDGEPDSDAEDFFSEMGTEEPDLEMQLRLYNRRWRHAVVHRNRGDESYYQERIIRIQNAIRQQKLMEDKLGLEKGEILAKRDVERFIYAFVFWLMRSTRQQLKEISRHLLNIEFAEEAYQVLQPQLLSARFLSPLTKAVTAPSGVSLPKWYLDALRDAVDDVLEDGAVHFDRFVEQSDQQDPEDK